MEVIKPVPITDDNFVSSSIPEPDPNFGEVEWDSTRSSGKAVNEISDGAAIASGNTTYSVLGWNTASLIATAYLYDASFVYQGSVVFASGSPYISGNRQDICFDGSKYWFANGDQISRYNSNWTHDGTTINTDAQFFNAWAQAICSDGTFVYVTMRDNTELNYFIAKYKISDGSFVESKVIQQNIEINIKGSDVVEGRILHFARFSGESSELSVYETSLDLIGFSKISKVGSREPEKDTGLTKLTNGFSTLNPVDKEINLYDESFSLQGLYKIDDKVIKSSTHTQYQCTIATDDDPEVGVDKVPQTWVDIGATNRWKMIDDKVFSKSVSSHVIISAQFSEIIDSLAVFEMINVDSVRVQANSTSSGGVYDNTFQIGNGELVVTDIPPFDDLLVTVTFNGVDVEIGEMVIGISHNLGVLETGVQDDVKDYSRTEFDEFGQPTLVRRPIVNQSTYPVAVDFDKARETKRLLNSLRAVQAVWIGELGKGEKLITYGYVERAPMVYDNHSVVKYQIKVRGSI